MAVQHLPAVGDGLRCLWRRDLAAEAADAQAGASTGNEGRTLTPAQLREQLDLVDKLRKSGAAAQGSGPAGPAPPPASAEPVEVSAAVPEEERRSGRWLGFLQRPEDSSAAPAPGVASSSSGTVGGMAPVSTEFDSQVTPAYGGSSRADGRSAATPLLLIITAASVAVDVLSQVSRCSTLKP